MYVTIFNVLYKFLDIKCYLFLLFHKELTLYIIYYCKFFFYLYLFKYMNSVMHFPPYLQGPPGPQGPLGPQGLTVCI